MDPLTAFGALAVTAMMLFYALEGRSPTFVLLFAGACRAASAYGFLQGAWPFGVVELVWSGVAVRRCFLRAPRLPHVSRGRHRPPSSSLNESIPRANGYAADGHIVLHLCQPTWM